MGGMMAPQPMAQPEQQTKPTGMFGAGKGSWVDAVQAAIGGFLAARGNPAGGALLGMANQRRQTGMAEQQHQQRRGEDFEDYVKKQAWDLQNKPPVNNDTVADYEFIVKQLGPEAGQQFLRSKTLPPPQFMNVPGLGLVQMPSAGAPQMPTAPVGKLTPIDDGGPAPQGPGGFRSPGY
jgi:hypothetical protein